MIGLLAVIRKKTVLQKNGMRGLIQIVDIFLRVVGSLTLLILLALSLYLLYPSSGPEKLTSISDFRVWQPDVNTAQQISIRDVVYYAVSVPRTRVSASGPSEYYFDANGFYIDMNGDISDFYFPWLFHPSNKLGIRTPIDICKIPEIADQTESLKF